MLAGVDHTHASFVYGLLPAVVAFAGLAFFIALPRVIGEGEPARERGALTAALSRAASWVRDTEEVAFTPNWRLLGTVGYLVFDIAVLWACLRALGVKAPIVALVLGYQIGYLANLVPIPGGLGVLEGGLLGALLLYGLPAAPTAAAVVLYHSIALWVPTLGGTVGFARLRGSLATQRPHAAEPQPVDDPSQLPHLPAGIEQLPAPATRTKDLAA